jgi:hypothetical protein
LRENFADLALLTAYALGAGIIPSLAAGSGNPNPYVPTALRGQLDHVYVESDDGYNWGCFGRDRGSTSRLNSADGNSALADCLSKPIDPAYRPAPIYAGLRYAFDGVCHQAANRILKYTGITVAKARGYGASIALYGEYGRGNKKRLQEEKKCIQLCLPSGPRSPTQGGPDMLTSSQKAQLSTFIDELRKIDPKQATEENAEDLLSADELLWKLYAEKLGATYSPEKLSSVARLQHNLQINRIVLVGEAEAGEITPDVFLSKFEAQKRDTFARCESILGKDDFRRLFDTTVEGTDELINANVFLGHREVA